MWDSRSIAITAIFIAVPAYYHSHCTMIDARQHSTPQPQQRGTQLPSSLPVEPPQKHVSDRHVESESAAAECDTSVSLQSHAPTHFTRVDGRHKHQHLYCSPVSHITNNVIIIILVIVTANNHHHHHMQRQSITLPRLLNNGFDRPHKSSSLRSHCGSGSTRDEVRRSVL